MIWSSVGLHGSCQKRNSEVTSVQCTTLAIMKCSSQSPNQRRSELSSIHPPAFKVMCWTVTGQRVQTCWTAFWGSWFGLEKKRWPSLEISRRGTTQWRSAFSISTPIDSCGGVWTRTVSHIHTSWRPSHLVTSLPGRSPQQHFERLLKWDQKSTQTPPDDSEEHIHGRRAGQREQPRGSKPCHKPRPRAVEEGEFLFQEFVVSGRGEPGETSLPDQARSSPSLVRPGEASLPGQTSEDNERVLGMDWDPVEDQFRFKVKLNFSPRKRKVRTGPDLNIAQIPAGVPIALTKRMILSQVNGIYDPMGLAGPVTVKAKILTKKLWAREPRLGWDDPIPDQLRDEWVEFFRELFELEQTTFTRSLKPEDAVGNPSLIVFSDGSTEAFGACAYARWALRSGGFGCKLIASKTRLAPLRRITIVWIELCGAVLSKRLRAFIEEETRYRFESCYHIVDSEIVRAMIQKESYGFNSFVATRIGEIQNATDSSKLVLGRRHSQCSRFADARKETKRGRDWQPMAEWPIIPEASSPGVAPQTQLFLKGSSWKEQGCADSRCQGRWVSRSTDRYLSLLQLHEAAQGDGKGARSFPKEANTLPEQRAAGTWSRGPRSGRNVLDPRSSEINKARLGRGQV